jgi:hypothetical protein
MINVIKQSSTIVGIFITVPAWDHLIIPKWLY